jgi:hypothetical protein
MNEQDKGETIERDSQLRADSLIASFQEKL